MADLFNTKGNQYTDDGSLIVDAVTSIEKGKLTVTSSGATIGSTASIYDSNDTTFYQFLSDSASEGKLHWDLGGKKKFKNIYVYGEAHMYGTGDAGRYTTFALEGSLNGTDWTVYGSGTDTTGAWHYFNIVATDKTCRYLRVRVYGTGGVTNFTGRLYMIKGVV